MSTEYVPSLTQADSIAAAQLRREKIRTRDSLSPFQRQELSRRTVSRILASPEYERADTVMIYRATRGELSLDGLESASSSRGKRFVFPLCVGDTKLIALHPRDKTAWKPGRYGILEPVQEGSDFIFPDKIDLVICPCTVFDPLGHRIGMGSGYYDRFLPSCTRAHVAAAAFEVQKVPLISSSPWDCPMELIFTEAATYRAGPESH